jgi:hypothetical protein
MARSRITSPSKDLIKDNGAVLISIADGEQLRFEITFGWLVNLSGYEINATVVEGLNTTSGGIPVLPRTAGIVTELPVINIVGNTATVVIPEELITDWLVQPGVDRPVYGFIEIEIRDPAVGVLKQVWKPIRGLIEVLYSPTEFS